MLWEKKKHLDQGLKKNIFTKSFKVENKDAKNYSKNKYK